ncbi:MAG: P-II family nitrogen regulator [Promethearchaeota archaeon]
MHLLVIVLNSEELLDEVLEIFVEVGITGATILDSEGMGKTLAYQMQIFAGLKKSMKISNYNKTIFSIVQDDKILEEAIFLFEKNIDFDTPGTGILFVIPVTFAKGISQEELG